MKEPHIKKHRTTEKLFVQRDNNGWEGKKDGLIIQVCMYINRCLFVFHGVQMCPLTVLGFFNPFVLFLEGEMKKKLF